MAYEMRFYNDPMKTGYIVEEKVRCGKKNCHCFTESKLHTAYYLHYRKYVFNPQKGKRGLFAVTKLKKYIRKADVEKIKKRIAMLKGYFVYTKLTDKEIWDITHKYQNQEDALAASYQKYLETVWKHGRNTQKSASFAGTL
jgi:hypothetical protein